MPYIHTFTMFTRPNIRCCESVSLKIASVKCLKVKFLTLWTIVLIKVYLYIHLVLLLYSYSTFNSLPWLVRGLSCKLTAFYTTECCGFDSQMGQHFVCLFFMSISCMFATQDTLLVLRAKRVAKTRCSIDAVAKSLIAEAKSS